MILLLVPSLWAQRPGDSADPQPAAATPASYGAEPPESEATAPPDDAAPDRTELNLLGEVNSESGESRRNENVQLTLIDNNVQKEINQRMGVTATLVDELAVEQGYFGAEYGDNPSRPPHLSSQSVSGFHGNLFWTHNNSVFSARSFFQVGRVQPARSNDYGFNIGTPLWRGASLTIDGSQGLLRGQVNGNILVPSAEERIPLTTNPEDLAIVRYILSAYPAELPNRTDIHPRALNTNAPQNINNNRLGGILDQNLSSKDHLSLRYGFTGQKVDAFQLVGGQNPNTTTRNHSARITWSRAWSPMTTSDATIGFDRVGSLLVPDETALGPFVVFGRELEYIGPGGNIPIDRAQNTFRYAYLVRHIHGHHTLTFGADAARRQINGSESSNHRGVFWFIEDFGRDPVTNLRMGTPSTYNVTIGDTHRGFRDWHAQLYAGDRWQVSRDFTLTIGLQYRPATAPVEVNGLSEIPFHSDWNNFGPQLGLAYRLPGSWGALRAAYGLHYGEIFPATYMQARFNPPANIQLEVKSPKLSDPLRDLTEEDFNPNARSAITELAPDLQTPYAHLYSFTWEIEPRRDWSVQLGYVGSRAHMLLAAWQLNRAVPVEGIEQISETVNDRRPDPRYFTVTHIHNGSRAFFDAAKVTLNIPRWKGFSVDASYWFSKSIDFGASYTGTAAGRDALRNRSPSQFYFQEDLKGVSDFDQRHAVLWRAFYEAPALAASPSWMRSAFGHWQFSSVLLLKTGTPFSVTSTDSAGWGNVDGEGRDNPVLLDPSILGRSIDNPDTSIARLPRDAFGTIEPTDLRGNLGRNTFRKDGIANLNVALSRIWPIGGDRSVLFRAESLNFTNQAQFAEPDVHISSDNFATITNTLNDGRTFRFTLQLAF